VSGGLGLTGDVFDATLDEQRLRKHRAIDRIASQRRLQSFEDMHRLLRFIARVAHATFGDVGHGQIAMTERQLDLPIGDRRVFCQQGLHDCRCVVEERPRLYRPAHGDLKAAHLDLQAREVALPRPVVRLLLDDIDQYRSRRFVVRPRLVAVAGHHGQVRYMYLGIRLAVAPHQRRRIGRARLADRIEFLLVVFRRLAQPA